MKILRFGKTELQVSQVAFGGIPIMRRTQKDAVEVVRAALDLGINFIDTAHGYSDSEEKIGEAISGVPREKLIIATKAPAADKTGFFEQLETSLRRLGIEYIDIYQHHGVSSQEKMDEVLGPDGAFEGMVQAIEQGKVRFPAFSSHSLPIAKKMMLSGHYDVTQIPFNFVDDAALEEIIPLAKKLDMGFISMKPLGGGLLEDAETCFRYLMQFESIVPDPGIETVEEITQITKIYENPKPMTEQDHRRIAALKAELGKTWCHRCNYCQPCPQDISISAVLSAKSMLKRMTPERAEGMLGPAMDRAAECEECRDCVPRCPYDLEIPELLKERRGSWESYQESGVWA